MGRSDGTKIKVDPFKRLEPMIMNRRVESLAFHTPTFIVSKTLKYIKEFNRKLDPEDPAKLKIFYVVLCALTRLVAFHPEFNRFIAGRRFWQRNEIVFSFVIKKEMKYKSEETLAKVSFSPFETLDSIRKKIYDVIHEARTDDGSEAEGQVQLFGKLPRFSLMLMAKLISILEFWGLMPKSFIKKDPMYVSAVVANLGSVGIKGAVIHHAYTYGTASFFVTANRIRKDIVLNELTEEIKIEQVMDFGITCDERVTEGLEIGYAILDFKEFLENPEILEEIPLIPKSRLEELKLKDLEKDPLYDKYLEKMEIHKQKQNDIPLDQPTSTDVTPENVTAESKIVK